MENGRKIEVLFFYFVSDTTRDKKNVYKYVVIRYLESITPAIKVLTLD
jgi:hypothetical protein